MIGKPVKVVFIDHLAENREKVYRGNLVACDDKFLKIDMDGKKYILPHEAIRKVNEIRDGD